MRGAAFPTRAIVWALAVTCVVYAGVLALSIALPLRYELPLRTWSAARGLDPALVAAVIQCESRYRPGAISPRGAVGLMQIMPDTGAWIAGQLGASAFDPLDLLVPETSIEFGTWYLRHLLDRFSRIEDALMAYNAGPTTVAQWDGRDESIYPETRAYVDRVLRTLPFYRVFLRFPWFHRITPPLPI